MDHPGGRKSKAVVVELMGMMLQIHTMYIDVDIANNEILEYYDQLRSDHVPDACVLSAAAVYPRL